MPIEANALTEKDELIAKFYTLRAGLSVIAEETDKIKAAEKELAELKEKNEQHNKQVLEQYNQVRSLYDAQINSCELSIKANRERREYLQSEASRSSVNCALGYKAEFEKVEQHKAGLVYSVLPGAATVIIGVFLSAILGTIWQSSTFPITLAVLSAYVFPFIFGHIHRKRITEREKAKMRAEINQRLEDERKNLAKRIFNIEEEIIQKIKEEKEKQEKCLANIEEAEKEKNESLDAYLPDIQKHEARLQNEVVPPAMAAAQSVKKAMLETSRGIVAEADWRNIDLLIFYLETGRADSLKEALQLADKQRQTDQIVFSVNEARMHICNTVESSIGRLGIMMMGAFHQISNQIQANHNEVLNTMVNAFASLEDSINVSNQEMRERINGLNATMKEEGDRIANAEHLNASLLKKINASSDQLVYELKYNQKYWNS